MTEAELQEVKEKVAYAEHLLSDLEKLDDIIEFLATNSGDEDNGVRLELKATYFPDDWMTKNGVHPEEETYEDASCVLGTYFGKELIQILEKCRTEMTRQFEELKM